MENQECKTQEISGFEWAIKNVCRDLFGKDALAKACGVSKSAIETQFRTIAGAAFPVQPDGTPATPGTLVGGHRGAARHEMLVIAVILRFLQDDVIPSNSIIDKISYIKTMTIEEMVPVIEAAKQAVAGVKAGKPQISDSQIAAMDSSPSLKRMAMMLGQSTSAMTARAKKMRRENESLTDSEIVEKIWFEQIRHTITELPVSHSTVNNVERKGYMSFISELSELSTVESETHRMKALMMCFIDSMAIQVRSDIADGISVAEPSPDITSLVSSVVSSVFCKHGIGSTNIDAVVEAYVENVMGLQSPSAISNSVEKAIDQHAVWEMFIKSLDESALNDLFTETGRPKNSKGCSAMRKFVSGHFATLRDEKKPTARPMRRFLEKKRQRGDLNAKMTPTTARRNENQATADHIQTLARFSEECTGPVSN